MTKQELINHINQQIELHQRQTLSYVEKPMVVLAVAHSNQVQALRGVLRYVEQLKDD